MIVMWLLGIVQFLMIIYVTFFEFNQKSPAVFMWATLLIMFGLMHMLNVLSGDNVYSQTVLNEASFFAISFCSIYLLSRYYYIKIRRPALRSLMTSSNVRNRIDNAYTYDGLLFLIFVLAMALKIIPYLQYVGDVFATSWSEGRDYSSSLNYLNSEQLARILLYSLSGLITLFSFKKDKRGFAVAAILIIGVILTRNRIEILPLICSLITIGIINNDKIKPKTIILASFGGVLIIYLIYALWVFRHYGTINDFIQNFNLMEFIHKINNYLATDNGELGLRRVFYYFINGDNDFQDFGHMHSYLRMLFVYIPTKWSFGLKPDDFAIAMGQAIGMAPGGSTHPTLFGDCYANLGSFGIFLGAFWAIYVSVMDYLIEKRFSISSQLLLFVLNAVVYVIIGRGSVYNGFWFVAYGAPLLILFDFLCRKNKIPRIRIVFK